MSGDVKDKYYLNLPLWPDFDIFNKTVDGLIPSARIESWEDFDRVVSFYCDNDHDGNYVFRGQKHYKWQLEPTLDRLVEGTVTEKIGEAVKNAKAGQVEIKNDKDGNIGLSIGKKSFSDEKLIKNFNAVISSLEKEKSNLTIKGDLIKSTYITSTMGVSYKIKLEKSF